MRINTNLTAMNTYTQYTKNNSKISSAVAKLSSGYAINSAADNAAGLAISEKMRAQIRGLNQASTNSQDAISLTQTAEGALSSSTEILQRMREISVQSSNDTNNTKVDREALQDEFSQLQNELNDISSTTTFNKKNLLDGSLAATQKSVTNASMGNTSMAVTIGNAAAGQYNFSVSVKQESAAVAGQKPTEESATMGSTAKNYFSGTPTVALGANAADSALLNGNYTMTTTANDDGSLTVTATGDNNQTFTANISSSKLSDLQTASASTAANLAVQFSSKADDAFTMTLSVKGFSNTTNGKQALQDAIGDTTVSVNGGVTEKAATYGVYASITGGSDVKLATGDTSVTFDNGVTIGFNKLTSSDLDTSSTATMDKVAVTVMATPDATTTASASLENFKFADSFTGAKGSMSFASDANGVITATDSANNKYTATAGTDPITKTTTDGGTATLKTLSFTDAKGNAAFTADLTATAKVGQTSVSVTFAAGTNGANGTVATPGHNYSKVFGDGKTGTLTDNASSSFTVEDKKGAGLTFQVGANEGDELVINVDKLDANYLGVSSAKVTTQKAASAAITTVDNAINQVSSQRAYLGAIQNRLNYKISNLNTSSQNMTSAESQIRDVDMAKEMTEFTNANILSQAATSMLAQANSLPQNVLSLLK